MARKPPKLGAEKAAALSVAWKEHTEAWARQRLMVMKLVEQHELSAGQIAEAMGVGRSTVFRHLDKFMVGGVEGLLGREYKGGPVPTLQKGGREAFLDQLKEGRFRRAKEAQTWIKDRTKKDMALSSVYTLFGKVGGVLKVPRKTHAKKDPLAAEIFKFTLPERLAEMSVGAERVRLWVLDEHRYRLLPVIRRYWSLRCVRVHAPYATKYQWGYLHEAMEVDGDNRMELFFTPSVGSGHPRAFPAPDRRNRPASPSHSHSRLSRFPSQARRCACACQPALAAAASLQSGTKPGRKTRPPGQRPHLQPALRQTSRPRASHLAELSPLREYGKRIAQLIGQGWLLDNVKTSSPGQSI